METQKKMQRDAHYVKLSEMKIIITQMAKKIRLYKTEIRDAQKQLNVTKNYENQQPFFDRLHTAYTGRNSLKNTFRHFHIAYCELRGKDRKSIEDRVRAKPLDENIIETFKQ